MVQGVWVRQDIQRPRREYSRSLLPQDMQAQVEAQAHGPVSRLSPPANQIAHPPWGRKSRLAVPRQAMKCSGAPPLTWLRDARGGHATLS